MRRFPAVVPARPDTPRHDNGEISAGAPEATNTEKALHLLSQLVIFYANSPGAGGSVVV